MKTVLLKTVMIALMVSYSTINSQSIPLPKNIQAPTTASLGKYGDVPVSLYNGSANVNIPLLKLEEKGIEMDISLSYDASGVGVGSVASWVGQNWTLNAGGVITRQVNGGTPDEFKILDSPYFLRAVGYIHPYSRDRLNNQNWADVNSLQSIEQSNMGNNSFPNPNIGKDSEPDIFTFNFMGHHGKFFMGEDGIWRVASDENFTVEILENDFIHPFNIIYDQLGNRVSKTIGKIVLKDDQGNKYTFGSGGTWHNNMAIEFSKDFFKQSNVNGYPDFWIANAWYLTKVENSFGITVFNLEYIRENGYTGMFYNYQQNTSFSIDFTDPFGVNCQGSYGSGIYGNGATSVGGQLISPVYLSKIRTPVSKIDLTFESDYSNALYYHSSVNTSINDVSLFITNLMSTMTPYDASNLFKDLMPYVGSGEVMNKLKYRKLNSIVGFKAGVNFSYNSVGSQRLNLNQVTINYNDVYSFEYDRFEQLPHLTSKAVDHLGYFRGTAYSHVNSSNHFNERSTNTDKVLIGSLKKIIYPTKGYTQFEYEPHTYSQYVSDNKESLIPVANSVIGGLRIKKIISKDLNNIIKTKYYKYVKGYNVNHNSTNSSGILNCLPKYHWSDWTTGSSPGSISGTLSINHFSINPIIPMSNFFGSSIGYSEVVEIDEYQGQTNGYTIYKYTSNELYRDEAFVSTLQYNPSPYQKFSDKSMLRGKLLEIQSFNSSNQPVKKKTFNYSDPNDLTAKFIKGVNISSLTCSSSPGNGFLLGGAYKIYYFDFKNVKDSEITILNGNHFKTDNIYEYVSYPQSANLPYDIFLRSKTTETYLSIGESNSENIQERFTYPFDENTSVNNSLVSNRILKPIKKEILKNSITLQTEVLEHQNMIPPFNIPQPKKTLKSKGDNSLEEEVIIDSYDSSGNITLYHTKDGVYTTLAWCYDKRFPIVKMTGNQTDLSFMNQKVNQIQGLLNSSYPPECTSCFPYILPHLNEIRNHYSDHLVTTYTFYPRLDVITSITDPKGDTQTYHYEGLKLKFIKDKDGNILSENQYHYRPQN